MIAMVVLGVYAFGVTWVWIGNVLDPFWEPMATRTKVKLALLWPYHLLNRDAYDRVLWDDYGV